MLPTIGAIDDKPPSDKAHLATAANCVPAAMNEAMAGKNVEAKTSRPDGCGVKCAK